MPLAAMLPALPSVAAEALEPACQVDRTVFASRLNQWALHVPQMGQRIDAMLANVDYVCADGDGSEMLFEAARVCDEKSSRQISFDWIFGHDTYPTGAPCRMFLDEPTARADEAEALSLFGKLDDREAEWTLKVARALAKGDHAAARRLQELAYADLGIHVEQW